ncbi:MAG: PQQ-binding-like beta-propeller repeat protein [Pirellulales bacterium]
MTGPFRFLTRLRSATLCGVLGFATALELAGGWGGVVQAGDWPQILGPHRNGTADDERLPDRWPAQGPAVLWRAPLGQGYAGPAIVGQRVLAFHRVGAAERLECFDLATGKSQWKAEFACDYRGGIDPDSGPRCVPVVAGQRVLAFGVGGDLHCVSLADGRPQWSRSLYADFQGDEGYFGAGSTPLVVGSRVLVNVGGRPNGGLAAFSLETGETLWQTGADAASYSAPTLARVGDRDLAVFVTRLHCVAVEPETGKEVFRFSFGKRGPTVNAATPLVVDQHLFLSASYGIGAVAKRWTGGEPTDEWANDETLSSQYATAAPWGKYLFGSHGREDIGRADFRCIELATGKVAWNRPEFGVAHVIRAGDKLLVVGIDGQATLARASAEKFEPLSTARLTQEAARALPALAHGRLVLRTNQRGGPGELLCVDVAAGE